MDIKDLNVVFAGCARFKRTCQYKKNFKKTTIVNEYISIMTVFGGDPNFANAILEKISE